MQRLYQETILKHVKNPHYYGTLDNPSYTEEGRSMICGDYVKLYVQIVEDKITDICFDGDSCAICTASTSIMVKRVKGMKIADIKILRDKFFGLLEGKDLDLDSELNVLAVIQEFPSRISCAKLAWEILIKE